MGNTVTMVLSANAAAYVEGCMKAKAAFEATANSSEQSAEKIVKSGNKVADVGAKMKASTQESGSAIGSAVDGIIARYASMGTVTAAISAAFQEHLKSMADKAKGLRMEVEGLTKALAPSGQLNAQSFEAVRAGLNRIGSDIFSNKDIRGTYAEISKRAGGESTIDEKRRATALAIQAGEAGHEDLASFGTTAAELLKNTRKGAGLEGMSDQDVGSVTAEITKFKPGGLGESDVRFLNRTKNKREALNLIIAAAKSAESARGLESLEREADSEPDSELLKKAKHHRTKLTEDERRKIALAQIPQEERISAMLKDDSLVPAQARRAVGNLRENLDADEIQNAAARDELGTQRRSVSQLEREDGAFRLARDAQRLDVRESNLKERNRLGALVNENTNRNAGLENAEAAGLDPGIRADTLGALGRVKDTIGGAGSSVISKFDELIGEVRRMGRAPALGKPDEDK